MIIVTWRREIYNDFCHHAKINKNEHIFLNYERERDYAKLRGLCGVIVILDSNMVFNSFLTQINQDNRFTIVAKEYL